MANIEGGGNIGFGGKPSKTPYLGFGITSEQHKAVTEGRGRPLTDGPVGATPRPSNLSRWDYRSRWTIDQVPKSHLDKGRPSK